MIRAATASSILAISAFALAPAAFAQDTMESEGSMSSDSMSSDSMASGDMPMVGGAAMDPAKTIPENASAASNLSTLVAALQAADLVETLSGEGPFTVFAPTNAAFEKLPDGTVDTLLQPENKEQLTKILTYHVVSAEATSEAAMQMIEDDGGEHDVTTVSGDTLTLKMDGDNLVIIDESGGGAVVEQADVMQANGVVHVIDSVLMPE
ncbi:fasciclin domain-containing protein [Jiella marina]